MTATTAPRPGDPSMSPDPDPDTTPASPPRTGWLIDNYEEDATAEVGVSTGDCRTQMGR